MNRITAIAFRLLAAGSLSIPAAAQQAPQANQKPRQVDLNEFVLNGNGLKKKRFNVRVEQSFMHFDVAQIGNPRPWDSTYMMTKFPAPTDKRLMLSTVEGRIADFDTSRFNLALVILQVNGTDTVFRQIPVSLEPNKKRPKNWHTMHIRDSGIVLQPAPFYLGYGYYTKPVTKDFSYRTYSAHSGGEGAFLRIKDGVWRLSTSSRYQIFPFRISYLEM